ncbi:MAG: flagellar basal body FlgE domain-containing protein [Methylococcaceae bacterium]
MTLLKKAIAPNAAMIAAVQPMNNTPKIIAPDAITNVEMTLNLNGTDKPITKAFSFLKHTDDASPYVPNPETYKSVVSMNIADTQGNEHVFSTYFAKTAVANEWNAYVFVDGRNIDTVKHALTVDLFPPLDLSALSAIDLSSATTNVNLRTFAAPLSPMDLVNFFPIEESIYQGEESTPPSISYLSSVVLEEGEITANPLKMSFDDNGQLVNVADVNSISSYWMQEANAEQLAKYVATHEPLPASFAPPTTTRDYFNHVDLSAINPALKSVSLNIAVDFANSTQFATPFSVNSLKQTWGLRGTDENDTISGSMGDDWIVGNMGVDKMTGGLGADTFTFYNAEESGLTAKTRDIITDFKHSDGDKIDVSLMLTEPAMHDFSFIGAKAFSKTDATGELRFDAATHILYGSTDADNKAEFSIQLNGVKILVADDFVL